MIQTIVRQQIIFLDEFGDIKITPQQRSILSASGFKDLGVNNLNGKAYKAFQRTVSSSRKKVDDLLMLLGDNFKLIE